MWKWKRLVIAYGLGNPLLYLASIGIGLGKIVDSSNATPIDGVSYLHFLAPALLSSAAIITALEETSWPVLEGFVWGKQFRAIGATSITARQLALGVYWVSLLRSLVTSVLYWLVLLGFHAVPIQVSAQLLAVVLFAAAATSALTFAIAVRVTNDDAFMSLFSRFAVMPLFLFSGTFYPLESLTPAVRWIGWLSPLWHATDLGRWVAYGHSVSGVMLAVHLSYLTALLVGGLWATFGPFEKRLYK